MKNQKISIIVPIYKVEPYLERCIDSILSQSYSNLEIILVDDGSPDNCPQICDSYAAKDDRIIVIHKKNGGLSEARNYGLDKASGDYIVFVDSDDYIRSDMCEVLLKNALTTNADMVLCDYHWVDNCGNDLHIKNKLKNEILTPEQYFQSYMNTIEMGYIIAWNKLYKKYIFKNLRFPVGKINEDYYLMHRIIYKCQSIMCITEKLYYYVQTDNSIMRSKFTARRMDIADALYDQIQFASSVGNNAMRKFAINRLSNELVRYRAYLNDPECLVRYRKLQHKFRFLAFEKDAWASIAPRGRLYYRLEILFPNVMRVIHKQYIKLLKR